MGERDYDVAVVGGGSAGLTAAALAGTLGAKTALISEGELGGECTWTGCIPSKTLLHAAHAAQHARAARALGVHTGVSVDFDAVMERVRRTRADIYEREDAPPNLARYGVSVFRASAHFVDRHTVELDGEGPTRVTARWFVIATGSRPKRLALDAPTFDNESIWDVRTLPKHLVVLGGGPAAVETAQAFRRLGSAVTIVTISARILERDDAECAAILARRLESEGIAFAFGCTARQAIRFGGITMVTLSNDLKLEADALFCAVGREARIENLGLEKAGISLRDGRIAVDKHCRTSAPNVYAAGDVATEHRFTHVAERMATIAIKNAILKLPTSFDAAELTWTTFTEPELAQVGLTQAQIERAGTRYTTLRSSYARLDRAATDDAREGLVKVFSTPRGRILGASIVGARAGETIAEIAVARRSRLNVAALSQTLYAYPTYALAVRRAADGYVLRGRTDWALRALRLLRRLRGQAPPLDVLLPDERSG